MAMSILATHTPRALIDIVATNDHGALTLVPGVGKKTAERLIIELRGTLEGLAARLAAERGCSPDLLSRARDCLQSIDLLLAADRLNEEAFSAYVARNEQFHALLQDMAGSSVLRREWERVVGLPFASPSGFVVSQANSPQARDMLIVAQDQHRQVLQAIEQREGARAEAIMREHSRLAQRNLSHAVRSSHSAQLPGVKLIRRAPT